jgi:SAM-dependent methyltransferase
MHRDPTTDPTTRFSTRAGAYERYRPSYPPEVLALAQRECGVTAGSRIADIGCGPGIMSRIFLDAGCEVLGVEPNAEMREAGVRSLNVYPRFHSVAGRAEATGLPDSSVDVIVAAQAFHWFEPVGTCAEFRRILRPDGWVMLVWNERREMPGFMADYDAAIAAYAPEQPRVNPKRIADFFAAGHHRHAQFYNEQHLDREGLHGRIASCSYAPEPGTPTFDTLMHAMDKLFARYQENGVVRVLYETDVFYGRW